jgi:hypothetical protein
MIVCLLVGWFTPYWQCYFYIVYGYFARIIAGPRLCPNAWLVLFVLYPVVNKYHLLENEIVPSAPKRFAQTIGLVFAIAYIVLIGYVPLAARIVSLIHISVSLLAAVTGFCVGCYTYHAIEDAHARYASFKRTVSTVGGGLIRSQHSQSSVAEDELKRSYSVEAAAMTKPSKSYDITATASKLVTRSQSSIIVPLDGRNNSFVGGNGCVMREVAHSSTENPSGVLDALANGDNNNFMAVRDFESESNV